MKAITRYAVRARGLEGLVWYICSVEAAEGDSFPLLSAHHPWNCDPSFVSDDPISYYLLNLDVFFLVVPFICNVQFETMNKFRWARCFLGVIVFAARKHSENWKCVKPRKRKGTVLVKRRETLRILGVRPVGRSCQARRTLRRWIPQKRNHQFRHLRASFVTGSSPTETNLFSWNGIDLIGNTLFAIIFFVYQFHSWASPLLLKSTFVRWISWVLLLSLQVAFKLENMPLLFHIARQPTSFKSLDWPSNAILDRCWLGSGDINCWLKLTVQDKRTHLQSATIST